MKIQCSLKWISRHETILENGFKNSKALKGFKELPLFPATYKTLIQLYQQQSKKRTTPKGLIFSCHDKSPFIYRKIQYAFDKAFKKANLPYRGTHILRHGGSRRLFRRTANLETAKQLLGNTDIQTTMIYTNTQGEGLRLAARKEWRQAKTKPSMHMNV